MSLPNGTRIGPYEILGSLGAGGMGEVYRARDTKLNRDIAIKVLLPAVANDPERLARFSREAQLLAALNHPNIAAIYGLEDTPSTLRPFDTLRVVPSTAEGRDPQGRPEHGRGATGSGQAGVRALVMELVEGPTLAEIIERASSGSGLWTLGSGKHQQERSSESQEPRAKSRCGLPVEEAVAIARQIAGALEAAHEQGIIHRDLKPANVKVKADGTVKVLDFGLAKALDPASSNADVMNSPTLTGHATRDGIILGTAAYMSPEQARGKTVDTRADIWAFGCVLYEMLTGRRAFGGDSVADTLATVMTREPDWSALPPSTSSAIRRLLRRCLQKDPARRLRHVGDAAIEIEEAQADASNKTAQADAPNQDNLPPAASRLRVRLAWTLVLTLASIVGVLVALILLRRTPAAPEMRVEINTPPTNDPASIAISPDGQTIAFVATDAGRPRLWLRSLDAVSARPLAGTDGAKFPFWAPHGRSIGFFADDGKLKRIDLDGGVVRVLANALQPRGGAWNGDDTILFVPSTGPIFRMSAGGGERMPVTSIEAQQSNLSFPRFLPDGDHFVYYVSGGPDVRGVYAAALDGTGGRRLVDADSIGVSTSLGYLLFVRGGTLFAQQLDPARLELTGSLFPVAEAIALEPLAGSQLASVSASAAGHIVYRSGVSRHRQFVWFDRSGREVGKVGNPDSGGPLSPAISASGRRVALLRTVDGNVDIWLLDTERGGLSRFTSHVANEVQALWSPDDSRILFMSNRTGSYELYEKSTLGAPGGEAERVLLPMQSTPTDWSRDGRFLLFQHLDPKTNFDIWVLPYGTDQKPFPLVQTDFDERDAQFSPDGMWMAYSSVESGRSEIYVQPFPGPGARTPISINGGAQPRWRSDGKELFFLALDERLMAVPISLPSTGGSVEAGAPVPLFATRIGGAVQNPSRQQYFVSPDGSRFLMNTVLEGPAASPITLILNWKPRPPGSRE